ncbi:hypothetical protein EYF80_055971 [Liparis tanakae]|uniref:Uncharacterized protein n=1 Tax=Liparis tanakae TaxID=230148 RepID=A0A4Z2EZP8_9TELE|nr:hypothetical protein EYF80_055971 [Liparis tanakae]
MVLCRLELTLLNMSFPTMVAMVGKTRAPHRMRAQHVVLPADHLAEDQHDGDGGQADEQEQRVGPLHHVQPLLVAHHLQGGGEVTHGAARAKRIPVGGATAPPPRYDQLTSVDTTRWDFRRHVA